MDGEPGWWITSGKIGLTPLARVHGCAVSMRYIHVCNCDMFSFVNVYLDHLKLCVVCIDGRRYVCGSECNVVSDECNKPPPCLVQSIGTHGGEVMYFGCVCFRDDLGLLNCYDIGMCVVNTQFELLEFVFDSVYVDLQYDEISLIFTAGSVSLGCVCSHVVVFGLSMRLLWYPMWMRWLLCRVSVFWLRWCG